MGSFPVGTELVFRLHVNNTGNDFFTGPGERNADQQPHARVQEAWQPEETLVSFEDLLNGPFVYHELSFSFTNSATSVLVCDAGGPYFGSAGVEVEFDGSGSTASNSEIVEYAWDFGDASQGVGMVVYHSYQTDGIYDVTLCITDDEDQTSCCSPDSGSVIPTQTYSFESLKSFYR